MFRREHSVRVLEQDPDLAMGLDDAGRREAEIQLMAPAGRLPRGEWDPDEMPVPDSPDRLGVLVLDGLMTRDVLLAGSTCAELVGPGDILRPWHDLSTSGSIPSQIQWKVLESARLALLDRHFTQTAARWPEVISALLTRSVTRSQSLAVALAITCMSGLERRCLVLLWHLADRYGRVGTSGVSVPLPLTHQLIARLVGASRPSVSTALKALERGGQLERRPQGGYLLHGDPPEDLAMLHEPRREPAAEQSAPA